MRKGSILRLLPALLIAIIAFSGCTTDFDVYAPPKDIRAVYAVLNPEDSAQYVRVATVYQIEGDAIQYAGENDLSLKNLDIRLTADDGTVYQAVQVDSFPKDTEGIFYPYHTVYKLVTDGTPGNPAIQHGMVYHLELGASDNDDYLHAYTRVPVIPEIRGELSVQSGVGNTKCLPKLELTNDLNFSFEIGTGYGNEIRVRFRYEKNGTPDSIMWGPTDLIQENRRCNDGSNRYCYQFGRESLLEYFKARLPEDGSIYTYDTDDSCVVNPTNNPTINERMPKSLEFEVTAVDDQLGKYVDANNPAFLDLTGAKPEYSNIEGKIQAVGIFGSIAKSRRYAIFRTCTAWRLGLNGISQPPGCF